MTASNQPRALQLVLAHEGGYVNHPRDPGGATNKGVTQGTYDNYRASKGLKSRSVRSITTAELHEIYDRQYWDKVQGDRLPAGVDYAVFDYAVNSGPGRAVKDLQRTVGAGVDGVIGDETIRLTCAAADADEEGLIASYCNRRMSFLKRLKTYSTFGKGWKRRVIGDFDGVQDGDHGVIDYATMMARGDLAFPIPKKALPTAIGLKDGEEAGKGEEQDRAALKTPDGLGAVLSAAGAGGTTLISTAQQVQPHIGESIVGRLALVAFVLLIVTGASLVAYNWFRKQRELTAA